MLRFLLAFPILMTLHSPRAQDTSACGDPPIMADEQLKGDIEGRVQALSRFLGDARLSGQLERNRRDIFDRYGDADQARTNAYLLYQFCLVIMSDTEMSTREKINEIIRIKREISKPVAGYTVDTETWGSVEAHHNCGAGKLSGDAITDMRVTNLHGRSANVDIDYSYNPRHLEEEPIAIRAYLLTESQHPTNRGQEVSAGGHCDYQDEADVSSANVGTASLTVCVEQEAIETWSMADSLYTHEIFIFIAGTYSDPARGGVLAETDPYVCQRFPFPYTWH